MQPASQLYPAPRRTHPFKSGDIAICHDASGAQSLRADAWYQVSSLDEDGDLHLTGIPQLTFLADRFHPKPASSQTPRLRPSIVPGSDQLLWEWPNGRVEPYPTPPSPQQPRSPTTTTRASFAVNDMVICTAACDYGSTRTLAYNSRHRIRAIAPDGSLQLYGERGYFPSWRFNHLPKPTKPKQTPNPTPNPKTLLPPHVRLIPTSNRPNSVPPSTGQTPTPVSATASLSAATRAALERALIFLPITAYADIVQVGTTDHHCEHFVITPDEPLTDLIHDILSRRRSHYAVWRQLPYCTTNLIHFAITFIPRAALHGFILSAPK